MHAARHLADPAGTFEAVPSIRWARSPRSADVLAVVTRWGRIGPVELRPADRLVVRPEGDAPPGTLLLLVPRGRGNPMVGRRQRGELVAEPGSVPTAAERWRAAGRLAAVERDLERAVVPPGRWWLATGAEVRAGEAAELDAVLRERFRAARRDGSLPAGSGIAATREAALALAATAPAGSVRYEVRAPELPPVRRVLPGPWPASAAPARRRGGVQLSLFGDSRPAASPSRSPDAASPR